MNPHRAGRPFDETKHQVQIHSIRHRRDAYRIPRGLAYGEQNMTSG
ncbi:MAG TPA: hypothetical protein VGH27_31210 [Streptosporangiaceae bacterium]